MAGQWIDFVDAADAYCPMTSGDLNAPRVLVLSAASLSREGATGITLSNLFQGWPHEKLAQIFGERTPPDPSICVNSYPFFSNRIPIVRVMKSLRARIANAGQGPQKSADSRHGIAGGAAKSSAVASFADAVPFRLPQDLIEWTAQFDPQVIYSPLGSIRMMSAALQLSKRFGIPIVPHFMDDWPSTVYANGAQYFPLRRILRNMLRNVLLRAPFGLTICEDMSKEYACRHGMRFEAFMNCVDLPEQSEASTRCANDQMVVFGYVGGLHLNRWKSLLDVTAALQAAKDGGSAVRLDIFAPEADIQTYRDKFDGFTVVRNMGSLGYSDVREKLREYDVLVHVESFLPADSRYTRLSISTKIPQYMAAQVPILAYGPDMLSSIAYVVRSGAGLAATKDGDVAGLLEAVRKLIEQPGLRAQLGETGRSIALEHHDAVRERERLMVLLAEAAAKGGTK